MSQPTHAGLRFLAALGHDGKMRQFWGHRKEGKPRSLVEVQCQPEVRTATQLTCIVKTAYMPGNIPLTMDIHSPLMLLT